MSLNNIKTKFVAASEVKAGDTIYFNGEATTVSSKFIKNDPFFGVTIYGQRLKQVELILFPKWFQGKIIGYFSQF